MVNCELSCLCRRFFFLFFFVSAFSLVIGLDTNSVSINGTGAVSNSDNYVTWATVQQGVSGSVSSASYNTLLGFYYDNIPPVTSNDYDSLPFGGDQNIEFSCIDDDTGCNLFSYSLDDVNYFVPWGEESSKIGIIVNTSESHHIIYFSNDFMDNNESAREIFTGVDVPKIAITGPASDQTDGLEVVFSFLATSVAGIKNYWVKMDTGNWVDNGTSTNYAFSITDDTKLPVKHVFYVKATGNADVNSNVASMVMTFVPAAEGIKKITPGNGGGEVLVEKEFLSSEKSFTPLEYPAIPVLDQTEKQPDLATKRFATEEELDVNRVVKVYAVVGSAGVVKYIVRVSLVVVNISANSLTAVEVIEGMESGLVQDSDSIRSKDVFEVLEESPPIIRFGFGDLDPGQKKTVSYEFEWPVYKGPVTMEALNYFKPPVALVKLMPDDRCMGAQCNDFNPCTRDYCVKGECRFVLMNNGAKCGPGNVCNAGKCVSADYLTGSFFIPLQIFTRFDYLILFALLFAIIFALAMQFTIRRYLRKKRGKLEE